MKLNTAIIAIFTAVCILAILSCQSKTEPAQATAFQKLSPEDSLIKSRLPDTLTPENHSMVMSEILGKPKHDIKSIGILVYDGVNDLDFMGPRYVLSQSGAQMQLIALKPGHITTATGMEIVPNDVIDHVEHLDILIIPGGLKGTVEASYNTRLHDWIRKIVQGTTYTGAVCTGVWVLGATGLLKGKNASTNWYRESEFLQKYGAIPASQRYTQDGKYWTSAGVTAGMDMALGMLRDNWGDKYTQAVMLDMEYDPAPPISGGSPEKTGYLVEWMMKSMYDARINPLIDSLEKAKITTPSQKNPPRHAASLPRISASKPAGAFANDLDFICGMEVMPDYTDTCHLNGNVYAFCSEYCKDKFKANPEKYLSKK